MIKSFVLFTLLLLMKDLAKGNENLEKFKVDMSFKGGYNPYRIFGDVPLPPKKNRFRSLSFLFGNCPCGDIKSVDSIYVRIKVASMLRYNLIKVFGYILHRKQIELNTDYYTSLHFILTVVKLNHVDIISLVDVLNGIAFEKPNKQFTKLFEAMEIHLPKYLTCAATLWKEGVQNKTIDMDKILIPYNDGTLVVNILDGITPEELKKVSKPDPPAIPADKVEEKILFDFNQNILKLYQTLKQRVNVNLFPWVIAAIIQFFPRTLIQPDLEESILVMTQYFYEQNISEFRNVDIKKEKREPFELIKHYLTLIIQSKNSPDIIKDSALTIVRNLKNRSPTAVNPHYSSFTYFIQPDSIKIDEMLKYISKGAFPLEIILAAVRVRFYIDQSIIGYFSIMTSFNPYLYSSPTEVLIAVLDRIMRRQPELSAEMLDSVGAVYSYLIFKYRYSAMPVTYPTDMVRMNVLIMGFKAPDVSKNIRDTIDSLVPLLLQEPLQYSDILIKNVPIYKCTTPVICFTELLTEIKGMGQIVDEKTEKLIVIIQGQVVNKGGLEININFTPDQVFPLKQFNKTIKQYDDFHSELAEGQDTTTTVVSEITTTTAVTTKPTTTKPPPTTPTEGPIQTASTAAPTTPTTPTRPPPKQTTDIVVPTELIEPIQPGNISALIIIIKNITETYTDLEAEQVQKMLLIMESSQFKKLMEQAENDHRTIIAAYLSLLELTEMEYTEEHFRKHLQALIIKMEKIQHILTEMTIEPQFDEPVLFSLTIALPQPSDDEKAKFDLLKAVLSKQELFKIIHKKIKQNELTTVGHLLTAVLREEAKLTDKLTKEELEAIQYYSTKVQKHGFADKKITYSFHQDVITKEVNISEIMDNALDYTTLEKENQKNFNDIIQYLAKSDFLQQWNKWFFYSTAGEFTEAMFKHLLGTPSISADVREAVNKLTPKVNLDKTGKKPSFPGTISL